MTISFLILVISVVGLAISADKFVESAVGVAKLFGLAPVVIGAVVIGFGTSVPEAVASGIAAYRGNIDVAVGNVLGSNAANLSLVLAVSALFAAIPVVWRELRREFIFMGVVWGWFAISILNGSLSRLEGVVGLVLAGAAVVVTIVSPAENPDDELENDESPEGKSAVLSAVLWLGALSVAAHFLVSSSLSIADGFGLSGGFAGAALVAVGTSLPEVFTAAASARRRDFQMLAGNVIGSNIFNAGFVGGLAAVIGPGDFSTVLGVQVNAVAAAIGISVLLVSLTTKKVNRATAVGLLALFAVVVVLSAQS